MLEMDTRLKIVLYTSRYRWPFRSQQSGLGSPLSNQRSFKPLESPLVFQGPSGFFCARPVTIEARSRSTCYPELCPLGKTHLTNAPLFFGSSLN